MKTVAIITEYNPFHNGHKLQIDTVRKMLGEDTAIIAVMSGNYTERGEIAVCDKGLRAMAAVECGVNLVLELPFPFSMSSAEFFAKSGVRIINSLGVVDYLCFGSECGNVEILTNIARALLSKEYKEIFEKISSDKENCSLGHAKICEMALKELIKNEMPDGIFEPNNILGLEYIKALIECGSDITPITNKRLGAGYNDKIITKTSYQSASGIREELARNSFSALDFTPKNAKEIYMKAIDDGKMPALQEKLDAAVIAKFRLSSPECECDIHECSGGLYNRLHTMSMEANGIISLTELTETKKYTKARIRRAIFNAYFGVTSSEVRSLPAYTQVLAMDTVGRALLKRIRKMSDFPVITKPSSYKDFNDAVITQKELSDKADSVYQLTLKKPNSGAFSLKFTPYVKD